MINGCYHIQKRHIKLFSLIISSMFELFFFKKTYQFIFSLLFHYFLLYSWSSFVAYLEFLFSYFKITATLDPKGIIYIWGPYERGTGGLEVWHLFADSIVFKLLVYCSFFRIVGGGQKSVHFNCKHFYCKRRKLIKYFHLP